MTKTDLLVVGGGPAGAAIATLAAQKGASVILLEKDKFPRDKVCGEFLSAEGCGVLHRLNMLQTIKSLGAKTMTSCLLADGRGRYVTSPLPQAALGISRGTLDTLLLAKAHAAGVTVIEQTPAIAPIVERNVVKGVTTKTDAYRAKLVVAADGRRSMLQRALHPGLLEQDEVLHLQVPVELARDVGLLGRHLGLDAGAFPHHQPSAELDLALELAQDLDVFALQLPFEDGMSVDDRRLV